MPRNSPEPRADPFRVLIVEDEHLVGAGLAADVSALGHECIGVVASGNEARLQADRCEADIILMDIRIHGEDGLTIAAHLWESLGVPSVIVSAYAEPDLIERAQHPGIFGYLIKPAARAQLDAALTVAMARANEAHDDADTVRRLESTLAERRMLEQAKWRLVQSRGISEPEAHEMIRRIARETRRRAAAVAAEILESTDVERPKSGSEST